MSSLGFFDFSCISFSLHTLISLSSPVCLRLRLFLTPFGIIFTDAGPPSCTVDLAMASYPYMDWNYYNYPTYTPLLTTGYVAQDHRNSTSAGPSNTGSGSFSRGNEGFQEHHSQSRKRDFASTTLGASHTANKSRRTTPVHFDDDLNNHSPWSNSGASSASVDFIDLTG
jgi:hypothetical protein